MDVFLFLDTNIPLGFIFFSDIWHEDAKRVFNNENFELFYSDTVVKELKKKIMYIRLEHLKFYKQLKFKLKNSKNIITKNNLINIGLTVKLNKKWHKDKIIRSIEEFWDYYELGWNCDKKDIEFYLEEYDNEFKKLIMIQKSFVDKNIILVPIRTKKYLEIRDILENCNFHYPDIDIILDAHDFGLNFDSGLDFLTSDNKLCESTENLDCLSIRNFYYLKFYFDG